MSTGTQLFDLGVPGVAKLYEDDQGAPVVILFLGGGDGETPIQAIIWDPAGIDGLIKLGQALRRYHQVPVPGNPKDSSASGGLTFKPV